ncbi:hypothetical protein [Magnetospirillum sulfuroxidans]|uniref:DUF4198 domain-containing protein n=1 Tax=Magnetospirillum sulfuroxidans TaxID=611300 RepID=A0ABS5I932_9PROT|nr:hypothetical protein [Magnetospirillum sulfuroxidans]MBR9970945.1 hypothetical protein [Magnetospirillum sulfuroxidans]
MRIFLMAAIAVATASPALAQHDHASPSAQAAAQGWTATPIVTARPAGRLEAVATPLNMTADAVRVVPPQGPTRSLSLNDGKARITPEIGNYHLVLASSDHDGSFITAATAIYFSNPGPGPGDLLAAARPGLLLLPERLPREHSSYRSGESVRFRLMADGQPLPGAVVNLETANGTHQRLYSDLDGWVLVTFPADFPPIDQRPPQVHGRPNGSAFALSARLGSGAIPRLASFAYTYGPDQLDGTSPWAGFALAVLGMVLAAPLVIRRTGAAK